MEASDSYLVAERMIHAEEISLGELERLRESLKEQQLITATEREALLQLA